MSRLLFVLGSAAVFSLLLGSTSAATCNLIDTTTNTYRNDSSAKQLEICQGDRSKLTAWERYQCQYMDYAGDLEYCWPKRKLSTCPPGQLKGAFFIYHGYSACPGEYDVLAPKLQAECWHVYQIATVGHAHKFCTEADPSSVPVNQCVNGTFNLTDLPTQRQPYIDFVNSMLDIIKEESDILKQCEVDANPSWDVNKLESVIAGLSFGAPLTAATAVMAQDRVGEKLFTKQIVMAPFFGITYDGLDNIVYKCLSTAKNITECIPNWLRFAGFRANNTKIQELTDAVINTAESMVDMRYLDTSYETFNLFLRKMLAYAVENPDGALLGPARQQIADALELTISWGADCYESKEKWGRGGFCSFQVKNLLAVHSFAMWVRNKMLARKRFRFRGAYKYDIEQPMLMIFNERDGITRNALCAHYVNMFYKWSEKRINARSLNCEWLTAVSCSETNKTFDGAVDNRCGVPHASLSTPSNIMLQPFELWWEDHYHTLLINWVNNRDVVNNGLITKTPARWNKGRDQCVWQDLANPEDSELLAPVPSSIRAGIRVRAWRAVKGVVTNPLSILDDISRISKAPRGMLQLTFAAAKVWRSARRLEEITDLDVDGNGTNETVVEIDAAVTEASADFLKVLAERGGMSQLGGYDVAYIDVKDSTINIDSGSGSGSGGSSQPSEPASQNPPAGDHTVFITVIAVLGVLCALLILALIIIVVQRPNSTYPSKTANLVSNDGGGQYTVMQDNAL